MYNRYIPQPDGSYKKDRRPESPTPKPPECAPPPVSCPPEPPCAPEPPSPPPKRPPPQHSTVPGFLRQLLPRDFDTGDLIVILLLRLMAGDCQEDRNHAILTIALYFLM